MTTKRNATIINPTRTFSSVRLGYTGLASSLSRIELGASTAATNTAAHLGHFIFLPSEVDPTFSLAPHSLQATKTLSMLVDSESDCVADLSPCATKTWPHEHLTFLPIKLSA